MAAETVMQPGADLAHMRAAADYFGIFFETATEFDDYLADMGRSRTWGDELTLRAAVEAFGCVAHVVTSEPANWYLVYTPEAPAPEEVCALVGQACRSSKLPQPPSGKEVFINDAREAMNAMMQVAQMGTIITSGSDQEKEEQVCVFRIRS